MIKHSKLHIKKIIRINLKEKFILVNLVAISIIIMGLAYGITKLNDDTYINSTINTFNSAYIAISKFVKSDDYKAKDYLDKVAKYYGVNVAVVDMKGNIVIKSESVSEEKIDMGKIKKVFQDKYDDGNAYQLYDISINSIDKKLLIWKPVKKNGVEVFVIILIISVLLAIWIMYIFVNSKVSYIKKIVKGSKEFSQGNLKFRIDEKGKDELQTLANAMNDMAKKLEENIEKDKAEERFKTELITNVSHDLRTPLTSLIGYIQLLDNKTIDDKNKDKYIKISLQKAYRLKNLLEDLFEYSKLECGQIKLNKSLVNIVEVIEQSIGELFMEAKNKNMTFNKNFHKSKIMANIDSQKIARVFENIIGNGIKYGKENTTIDIVVCEEKEDIIITFENYCTEGEIKDTSKIFERFYRGDQSRNSKVAGSGLGLAIAKDILELHQGKIWAEINMDKFKVFIKIRENS